MSNDADQPVDFESSLGELEALVGKMESGQLSLEQSLAAFERGVLLTRRCQAALQSAAMRVKALTQEGNEVEVSVPDTDG